MCNEVLKFLNVNDKKCVVDCTLGLGSHAQALLEQMPQGGGIG